MNDLSPAPDVVALRPFVPSTDFEKSVRFYVDLGFTANRLGDGLASMELGHFGFLLQDYHVEAFAGNFMMHLLVKDLDRWWKHIESLDLAGKYGVRAPKAPAVQPWGLIVGYVVDPSGVLWHFAQRPR
ncbi:MAG TPA: VOC family protein [Candidatus Sulfotelmatobacter sp.]|jgi:catechol 2,3-dioxygenase-like lactoylglutathione lyase family enzyme